MSTPGFFPWLKEIFGEATKPTRAKCSNATVIFRTQRLEITDFKSEFEKYFTGGLLEKGQFETQAASVKRIQALGLTGKEYCFRGMQSATTLRLATLRRGWPRG